MSEYILNDVPWDSEEIVDREPESSGDGKTHFGHLQLFPLQVTKVFEAGHYLTIPSVTGGNFDDKDENGLKKFKGWKAGGDQYLFVLVATKQDKEGNDYQIVKQLPSKLPRKGDPHLWADFTLPSFKSLSAADRSKMIKEGVYCQWSEVGTGHKVEIEGEEREIRAWANFKVFANKEAMRQAENGFWNERQNNSGGTTGSYYPASWVSSNSVQQTIEYGKTLKFENHADLAKQLMLTDDSGNPTKTPDGNDVDVARIISEVLGIPQPMVNL